MADIDPDDDPTTFCEVCKHDINEHDLDEAGAAYCYTCYDRLKGDTIACQFPS